MSKFATTLDPETVEAVLLHVDALYYDERDESKRIYDVHRDGSTELFRTAPWNDPSKRKICDLTDTDPRFVKIVA